MTVSDLIWKLRNLTSACSRTNREIALALGRIDAEIELALKMTADGRGTEYIETPGKQHIQAKTAAELLCYPNVTGSIDEAKGLVPQGWASASGTENARGSWAYIHNNESSFSGAAFGDGPLKRMYQETAFSEPIALCIAVLQSVGTRDGGNQDWLRITDINQQDAVIENSVIVVSG